MIHRTWPSIRISARRPRHAPEYRPRHSTGGASRDAGRAPACTARYEPIGRGPWAWSTMPKADWLRLCARPCCSPRCGARCPPCSRQPLGHHGWCRTRWSCATLALTLEAKRGIKVSAETMHRWVHEVGWVWKQAKLVAKDDDPHRVERLAHIHFVYAQLSKSDAS
jgi:hypothetical protein